jgi:hypothetical protein
MSYSRDASKKARGFAYQRLYAIFYFLDNDVYDIIDEGTIDGNGYEDITYHDNTAKIHTKQIKYKPNSEEKLNMSNDGFWKTINNDNNFKAESVEYIVSENDMKNSSEEQLSNPNVWNSLTGDEKYEKIIKMPLKSEKVPDFRKCKEKVDTEDKKTTIARLQKITTSKGLSYKKLIDEIYIKIENVFEKKDDMIKFYIRYKIFDVFEKNWFNINKLINRKDIITSINNDMSDIVDFKKINIENINNSILKSDPDIPNEILDLNIIEYAGKNSDTIKDCIINLFFLKTIYADDLNKEDLNKTCKDVCENLSYLMGKYMYSDSINIKTGHRFTQKNINEKISSMHYYNKNTSSNNKTYLNVNLKNFDSFFEETEIAEIKKMKLKRKIKKLI